ncbi:hypothetical protein [Nocardia fusca]|uniref:hypothetical protein n=1 Tax=Nocardia fusca TaxID=941183 RepID=UPI000B13A4DE|nr:hypothetical protein [Nocardia fusca]
MPSDTREPAEIRAIALRTAATTVDLPNGYRPPPEYYQEGELEAWWMGIDKYAS